MRKKHCKNSNYSSHHKYEEEEDEDLLTEIARLKQEQKELDLEVEGMNKRLQATERRPQQMMAFLYKVVEDPEIISRMMMDKERTRRVTDKKRRVLISSSSNSPVSSEKIMTSTSVKSEEEGESATVGTISSSISSPEGNFECMTSPETMLPTWLSSQRQFVGGRSGVMAKGVAGFTAVAPPADGGGGSGGDGGGYYGGWGEPNPPPYPFSLLGGGF